MCHCLTVLLAFGLSIPAERANAFNLAGSEWSIAFLAGVSAPPGVDAFVQFSGGGQVRGNGGCNRFFGTYRTIDDVITIGPLASTKKLCRENVMEFEGNFMAALQHSHKVSGGHLAIALAARDGRLLLRLKRRDWD